MSDGRKLMLTPFIGRKKTKSIIGILRFEISRHFVKCKFVV